jgi:hypothetical protein
MGMLWALVDLGPRGIARGYSELGRHLLRTLTPKGVYGGGSRGSPHLSG